MNNLTSIAVPALILLYVLFRQVQKRTVREDGSPVFLLVLLVIGVVELGNFVTHNHVQPMGVVLMAVSLAVSALFGVIRAYTVRLWREDGVLYRQGNAVTIVLWLVAIGLHFGADSLIDNAAGTHGLATTGLMLYIAVSFGVQRLVVQSRARAMVPARSY